MTFVVFEQDPLVRFDIIETLHSEFAECPIEPADEIQDLAKLSAASLCKRILILSLPDSISQPELDVVLVSAAPAGTVVITNAANGRYRLPKNSYYVQRPFGSDLLIKAVKTVLSDRPEHHS